MKQKATNIVWHHHKVKREDREQAVGHKGAVVWITGLSGSGKSTIANDLEAELWSMGARAFVLDGDNVRHGLNKDLGFSPEDREENIRRIGEVAHLFAEAGVIAITAFISPYIRDRQRARELNPDNTFVEVFAQCALNVCEQRDPKGLYKKARQGVIKEFTGISAPYEEPENAEVVVDTAKLSVDECVAAVLKQMTAMGIIQQPSA